MSDAADRRSVTRRRIGWLLNVAIVAAMIGAVYLVQAWRAGQFDGYGLTTRYFGARDYKGRPLGSAVEPFVDYELLESPHARKAASIEWSGTIVLPRTGKYVFSTRSTGESSLEIDGKPLVRNVGRPERRKVNGSRRFTAGRHAIKLRYLPSGKEPMMRVTWTPARRWGGAEPVPPTLLFAGAPDAVDKSGARVIPPDDATAMVLLLVSLLLGALLLGRRGLARWVGQLRSEGRARLDLALFLLLFALGLAFRLWDLSGAGQTWDEDVYWTAARNFADNLLAGDGRAMVWDANREHPALAKWLYAPATVFSEGLGAARANRRLRRRADL